MTKKLPSYLCALALAGMSAVAGELTPADSAAYLSANAQKPGVTTLPGLQYEILKSGSGASPRRTDCVTVAYKGSLVNGKVFDQTEPGKPFTYPLQLLIPGWIVALQQMHVGDTWRLSIPPAMAYGHEGAGHGVIPSDQTLIFDVELIRVFQADHNRCK